MAKSPTSSLGAEATKTLTASREELAKRIKAAKLTKHEAAIVALARPSIRVLTKKAKKTAKLGVGSSRFGGVPDLPPKTKWPAKGGTSLAFMAQLRCDELATYDESKRLPSSGLLSFFLIATPDSDEYGNHAVVLHFDEAEMATLTPTPPPEGDEREYDPKAVATISYRAELSLAPVEGLAIDGLRKKMSDDEHKAYWDDVWLDFAGDGPFHRLLGYPDMNYNYGQKKDELLFQIDTDDETDWNFGDAQATRLYISNASLAARDFKKIRANSDEE